MEANYGNNDSPTILGKTHHDMESGAHFKIDDLKTRLKSAIKEKFKETLLQEDK